MHTFTESSHLLSIQLGLQGGHVRLVVRSAVDRLLGGLVDRRQILEVPLVLLLSNVREGGERESERQRE